MKMFYLIYMFCFLCFILKEQSRPIGNHVEVDRAVFCLSSFKSQRSLGTTGYDALKFCVVCLVESLLVEIRETIFEGRQLETRKCVGNHVTFAADMFHVVKQLR